MSFGMQSSKSKPVDLTPAPFANLQGPFADVIQRLIGGNGGGPVGGPGTIYNSQYGTAGTPGTPGTLVSGTNAPGGGNSGRLNPFNPNIRGTGGGTTPSMMDWPGSVVNQNPAGTGSHMVGGTPGTMGTNPNNILGGIPYYQGPLVAGMTGNEQALLDKLKGQTANPNGGTGSAASNYLLDAIGGKYLPGQPGSNPFLQAAIEAAQRPTLEGLTQTLTRDLPGRFTQAGQFIQPQGSSAFDQAAALATRGAANANADIATNMSFQGYESERNRQQGAATSMPQVTGQEINNTLEALKGQALPRMIQDLGIERGIEVFNERVNNLLTTLGLTAGVTRPVTGQQSSSSGMNFGLPSK